RSRRPTALDLKPPLNALGDYGGQTAAHVEFITEAIATAVFGAAARFCERARERVVHETRSAEYYKHPLPLLKAVLRGCSGGVPKSPGALLARFRSSGILLRRPGSIVANPLPYWLAR